MRWLLVLSFFTSLFARAQSWQPIDAETLLSKETKPLIVDARTAEEYAAGHVPGAINISHDEMAERFSEIIAHKDQPIVLYCRSGYRAGKAAKTLEKQGFSQLLHLEGDFLGWQEQNLPVEQ